MDKLKCEQESLWEWLSSDPEYILNECGDLLSVNELKQIKSQSHASEEMKLLLTTMIQKGESTCQSFADILRKNQAHYPQLQQFFHPTNGAAAPTVFADSSSVFTAREINDVRGKSLSIKTDLVAGRSQSGNISGSVPQAKYVATDGSYICVDKICNANFDGDINLSVTVSSAQACAGGADETLPSSQEPAVRMIREHKTQLIDCLRADRPFILQHVQEESIVTDSEYQGLMEITLSEKAVTLLIDQIIAKGQESCSCFLQVLRKPSILETYPKLKYITQNWH